MVGIPKVSSHALDSLGDEPSGENVYEEEA
jgi:hypothetical protein